GSIQLTVATGQHTYRFDADGYTSYMAYLLIRDGNVIRNMGSYTPQLNVWHVLQATMQSNVLRLYFDGSNVGTYTEPDSGTNLASVSAIANWKATDSFAYLAASSLSSMVFSISASPSSAKVVKGDTITSSIAVNLVSGSSQTVSLSQSGCPQT